MPRIPEHLHSFWDHSEDNFSQDWSERILAMDYDGPQSAVKSWSCPVCNDFWRTTIRNMILRGNPCKFCNPSSQGISSNRRGFCHILGVDSVETMNPNIAEKWGTVFLDECTILFINEDHPWPDEISTGSRKMINLVCFRSVDDMGRHNPRGGEECLHISCQRLNTVTSPMSPGREPAQCPSCSRGGNAINNYDAKNALSVTNPSVAEELISHPDGKTVDQVKAGSMKRCEWRCSICEHEFCAEINMRTRNGTRNARTECPACENLEVHIDGRNSLQIRYPNAALHWDYERNGDFTPANVTYGSSYDAHWLCRHTECTEDMGECGHSHTQQVYSRTQLLIDENSHVPCQRCCPGGGYRDFLRGYYYVLEWDHPQHGSIFKNGITNVPLDRIGRLARSLHRTLGLTYRFVQIITNEDGAAIRRLEARNLRFTSLLVTLDEGVNDLDGRNEMFSRNMLEHANERGFIPDGSVDVTEELRSIIEDELIRVVAIEEE
jgi:hypothetical protein